MDILENQIKAGVFLSSKKSIKSKNKIDKINANIYQHPALGDEAVVRLNSSALAEGEILEMSFLGFEKPKIVKNIAQQKRKALGFPGWALINDPKHAHYALEVVKKIKKASRMAKSKPGHGQDMFLEIAAELGRGVPHFLPSYWEEVGRTFINFGNTTYGARAFGKARDAEKVHGLTVNIDEQRDAFVEFALSGAMSIKSLTQYAKDLQADKSALVAWQQIRYICVQRILGGLPPWAAMAKDLRKLIKNAKLDVAKEEKVFLEEILTSPAILKSPANFWKDYNSIIKIIVKENIALANLLLNTIPGPPDQNFIFEWLDYLKDWGLLESLKSKEFLKEPGIVAWFNIIISKIDSYFSENDSYPLVFELLETHQKAIIKDGRALNVSSGNYWATSNINLIERCLQLKLPINETNEISFNLTEWSESFDKYPENTYDPKLLCQIPVFKNALIKSIEGALGVNKFDQACQGKQTLLELRKEWFAEAVSNTKYDGLESAKINIDLLKTKATAQLLHDNPEIYEDFCKLSLAENLKVSLQGGILDEFGWPALEEASEKINPMNKDSLAFFGCAPYVVVSDKKTVAWVIGPNQIEKKIDLRIPKGYEFELAYYIDHDLLVVLDKEYSNECYWASNPNKLYKMGYWYSSSENIIPWQLKDGASLGGKVIKAGSDTLDFQTSNYFTDGENLWISDYDKDYNMKFFEYDIRLDKTIRSGMPSFFESSEDPKTHSLDIQSSYLNAIEGMSETAPFGNKGSLFGWRIIEKKCEGYTELNCSGIDGRATKLGEKNKAGSPAGLMTWPGSDEYRLINDNINDYYYGDDGSGIYSENGEIFYSGLNNRNFHCAGQITLFPVVLWQNFSVRDQDTSQLLREITTKNCEILFKAGLKDAEKLSLKKEGFSEDDYELKKWTETEKVIVDVFQKNIHPLLKKGLVGIVQHSAHIQNELNSIILKKNKIAESKINEKNKEFVEYELLCKSLKVFGLSADAASINMLSHFVKKNLDNKLKLTLDVFELMTTIHNFPTKMIGCLFMQNKLDEIKIVCEAWSNFEFVKQINNIRISDITIDEKANLPIELVAIEDDIYTSSRSIAKCGWGLVNDNAYFISTESFKYSGSVSKVLEYSPNNVFVDLENIVYDGTREFLNNWTQIDFTNVAIQIDSKKKPDITIDQINRVAKETGLNLTEASWLWCGFPGVTVYNKEYLSKEICTKIGLKSQQISLVKKQFKDVSLRKKMAVISNLDFEAKDLWKADTGKYADQLILSWNKIVKNRISFPESFFYMVEKELDLSEVMVRIIELFENKNSALYSDEACDPLMVVYNKVIVEQTIIRLPDHRKTFLDTLLLYMPALLIYVYENLPVGDSVRIKFSDIYKLMIKSFLKKDSKIYGDNLQLDYENEKYLDLVRDHFKSNLYTKKSVGKKNEFLLYSSKFISALDDGYSVLTAFNSNFDKSPEHLEMLNFYCSNGYRFYKLLCSDEFEQIELRIQNTPVPIGEYEMNPKYCVSELVDEVSKYYGITEESAVLYLQVLTLAKPTKKNILNWNHWKPMVYKNAVELLFEQKLLLEAKRKRAGRDCFLPGAWEELKAPLLPIEVWKFSLYNLKYNTEGLISGGIPLVSQEYGQYEFTILPLKPYHLLFQEAWQRILDGDVPKYEDVN